MKAQEMYQAPLKIIDTNGVDSGIVLEAMIAEEKQRKNLEEGKNLYKGIDIILDDNVTKVFLKDGYNPEILEEYSKDRIITDEIKQGLIEYQIIVLALDMYTMIKDSITYPLNKSSNRLKNLVVASTWKLINDYDSTGLRIALNDNSVLVNYDDFFQIEITDNKADISIITDCYDIIDTYDNQIITDKNQFIADIINEIEEDESEQSKRYLIIFEAMLFMLAKITSKQDYTRKELKEDLSCIRQKDLINGLDKINMENYSDSIWDMIKLEMNNSSIMILLGMEEGYPIFKEIYDCKENDSNIEAFITKDRPEIEYKRTLEDNCFKNINLNEHKEYMIIDQVAEMEDEDYSKTELIFQIGNSGAKLSAEKTKIPVFDYTVIIPRYRHSRWEYDSGELDGFRRIFDIATIEAYKNSDYKIPKLGGTIDGTYIVCYIGNEYYIACMNDDEKGEKQEEYMVNIGRVKIEAVKYGTVYYSREETIYGVKVRNSYKLDLEKLMKYGDFNEVLYESFIV